MCYKLRFPSHVAVMLALISLVNGAARLRAQSTWIGSTNGQWGAATNWSPGGVPNSVDGVVIWTNNIQPNLTSGSPFTNGTINIFSGSGSLAT